MNRQPGGHLDPDAVAEFRDGLITGRRARAIGAHLAGCADCAAVGERLAQVSALLAAAPVPSVPDALARRLDSALAAEVLSAQRASVQSPSPRRPPSWAGLLRVRVLATAAAVVAVLGGAGYALSTIGQSSYSGVNASAGSAAARPYVHPGASTFNGSRREASGSTVAGGSVVVVPSGVDYQPATLRSQLQAQLSAPEAPGGALAPSPVSGCVRRLTTGLTLRLVQSAHYAGAPAYVIVASGTGGEQAWVTGPNCSATHSDVLNHVVLSSGISAP
jgi:hypothetical protein